MAFRHSKTESDKVMTGSGPAKWGDTVEGTDEGDGWLKVTRPEGVRSFVLHKLPYCTML